MQTQHMPASALMHAKTYDAKENAVRNALQPTSANIQTAPMIAPITATWTSQSPFDLPLPFTKYTQEHSVARVSTRGSTRFKR